jgi:hypothetical protein
MSASQNTITGRAENAMIPGLAWAIGGALLAFLLSQVCIVVFAVLALILEVNTTRAVGLAINWIALLLMIGSYSAVLVAVTRYLTTRYVVPWTAWIGLVSYPLCWGLLMLAFPGSGYQATPAIVGGVGVVVAWLSVGLHRFGSVESEA